MFQLSGYYCNYWVLRTLETRCSAARAPSIRDVSEVVRIFVEGPVLQRSLDGWRSVKKGF